MPSMNNLKALNKAIKIAGGQTALALLINKRQQHVWTWVNRDKQTPATEARLIDEALNGKVTRYDLRPDVFGEQPQATK